MRVTNQMMAQSSLLNLNNLKTRMASLSEQISSGKRITKASEDPVAAGDTMRIQARAQALTQWESNIGDAKDWVRSTESHLTDMVALMSRASEIALAGSNEALDDASRTAYVPEVDAMIDEMVKLFNAEGSHGALFGGFRTHDNGAPAGPLYAIDKTTGVVTSLADSGDIIRDVGPGVSMTVNVSGSKMGDFTTSDNALKALYDLREALKGTGADVRAVSGNLKTQFDRLVTRRSEMGAADQRLDQLTTKAKELDVYLSDLLQQAQGVELERAVMDLSQADMTYRAALQVSARIFPSTLVDFLR